MFFVRVMFPLSEAGAYSHWRSWAMPERRCPSLGKMGRRMNALSLKIALSSRHFCFWCQGSLAAAAAAAAATLVVPVTALTVPLHAASSDTSMLSKKTAPVCGRNINSPARLDGLEKRFVAFNGGLLFCVFFFLTSIVAIESCVYRMPPPP